MKNLLSKILLILLTTAIQAKAGAKGTTTANFLKQGAGARAVAIGDAVTSNIKDADALYWNPAAMTNIEGWSASFTHAAYLESSNFDHAGLAKRIGEKSVFGLHGHFFSAGDIDTRDTSGTLTGSIDPTDLALTMGIAREIAAGFSLGVGAKMIRSKLVDTASTWAMDAGVLSPRYGNNKFISALAVTNVGPGLKFEQERDDLPMQVTAGNTFFITEKWMASADVLFPKDNDAGLGFGTEYNLTLNEKAKLAMRGGYNTLTASDNDGLGGVSLGLGFSYGRLNVDYAMSLFDDLGTAHLISISLR